MTLYNVKPVQVSVSLSTNKTKLIATAKLDE